MLGDQPGQRRTDPEVELGGRLAAGKHDDVRVALPVGGAETLDVRFEGQAVDVGAGVVLAERRIDLQRVDAERGQQRIGGLAGANEVAGDHDVGADLAGVGQSGGEARRLFEPER